MTKSTKALRERHQEDIRDLSLKYENIIKNRRFAIVYLLAKCSDDNKKMDITKLSLLLKTAPELFIISMTNFEATLYIETGIAAVAGIPFTHINNVLSPLTKVNIEKLTSGAPKKILDFLDEIYKKITV
jgi:hypothetical protein